MALLATSFTVEIILLIIGIYLFDGGIIRKFGAIGMFIYGLQLSYTRQKYVSDLTTPPTNVSLFFSPEIAQALVYMFAILTLITIAWSFVEFGKIISFRNKNPNSSMQELFEMMI